MLQLCKFYKHPSFLSPLFLNPPLISPPIKLISFSTTLPHKHSISLFHPANTLATSSSEAFHTKNNDDTFFANKNVSWDSLGVSEKLFHSLFNAGFSKPSLIQVLVFSSVLFKDVIEL